MSDEVPVWDMRAIASFRPRLTMHVSAPAADVLPGLAAALEAHKFKIKDADAQGFAARYVDWFSVASAELNWTRLEVTASEGASGTDLVVAGSYEGNDRKGRKQVSKGLSGAVADLRRRGVEVTVTPWAAPPDA